MNQLTYGGGTVMPLPHPSVPLGYGGSIGSYGNPMGMPASSAGLSYGSSVAPTPSVTRAPSAVTPVGGPIMSPQKIATDVVSAAKGASTNGADPNKPGFFGADGFTLGDMKGIVDIIGGFGSLWSGIQMNKLAKETLAFNKDAYNRNLTNSISSYNLALEDRMRSRYAQKNGTQAEADAEIARHKLVR